MLLLQAYSLVSSTSLPIPIPISPTKEFWICGTTKSLTLRPAKISIKTSIVYRVSNSTFFVASFLEGFCSPFILSCSTKKNPKKNLTLASGEVVTIQILSSGPPRLALNPATAGPIVESCGQGNGQWRGPQLTKADCRRRKPCHCEDRHHSPSPHLDRHLLLTQCQHGGEDNALPGCTEKWSGSASAASIHTTTSRVKNWFIGLVNASRETGWSRVFGHP